MMTSKQCHLYWRLWRSACRARGWRSDDRAFRHQVHRDLLGYDISHRDLSNADLDYLKYTFIFWADPENLEAIIYLEDAAGNGERKRLLFSIDKLAPAAYRRSIAVDLFDCADLTKLNLDQLTLLRNTLNNRVRAKATRQRREGQVGSTAATTTAAPRQYVLRLHPTATP